MQVFKVIKPGFLALIEDYGRYGYTKNGVANSGVLDEHAYLWGNYLLGNHFNAPSLEINMGNVCLEAFTNIQIVVTGADLNWTINNKIAPTWQVVDIYKNDRLIWQHPISGMRAYLAVRGGFKTQKYFHSSSVNRREKLGKALIKDEILSALAEKNKIIRTIPRRFIPSYDTYLTLHFIKNIDNRFFDKKSITEFCQQSFTINDKNDRTAYQLTSESPVKVKQLSMISEPNHYGSIQITHSGDAIVILKDYPTIGGYPKIGTVFSLDLAKLAQRKARAHLNFKPIKIAQAQMLRKKFNLFFNIDYRQFSKKI